jgi:tRNA-specific 2-thiouridylase
MSGGVDSSVAAAIAIELGHEVVGATMKLWGGPSDTGCCSVSDTDDARRVAQQLGMAHHVFNFSDEFSRHVVEPYVDQHSIGMTPNPCIECNRHLKFDRLLERALLLDFDAVVTGHHARVVSRAGRWRLLRGADVAKDQSYVLHMLDQERLERVMLPVGELTKAEVRSKAASLGLRTAGKADSQDVCFISRKGGREEFLGERIPLTPASVVDPDGSTLGTLPAIELVTIGQRRGLGSITAASAEKPGLNEDDRRRYVVGVDPSTATVTVGPLAALMVSEIGLSGVTWVDRPPSASERMQVQMSAHGLPVPGRWRASGSAVVLDAPVRRVAPGQSVVLYRGDEVVGGGIALR